MKKSMFIWRNNYANGIVWGADIWYENCWEKESEYFCDGMFKKFGWSDTNGLSWE